MADYANVWDQFDVAVNALYEALQPSGAVPFTPVRSPELVGRADLVIATSSRLADAAAEALSSPRVAECEQSMLRLVAGAAADLAIANDLMRAENEAAAFAVREAPLYSQLMSDLGSILRPENGAAPAVVTRSVPFAPPITDPDEALAQLRTAVTESFDAIAGDVIEIGQMVISGVITLPTDEITAAAAVAVQEILNLISDDIGAVLRRVAQLLVQAYDKILKALGQDMASQARQQAAKWIETLQSGTMLNQLVERLYEKQRILDDVEAHARQATERLVSGALFTALDETRALVERFQRQRQSLEWVLRGLAFAKDRLFGIQPWGPLGVTAMYVGTLGYAVYAGGDYVDWFRTGDIRPLNRIPGLRDVVHETLARPTE